MPNKPKQKRNKAAHNVNGSDRQRLPVDASSALTTAGTPGSPPPPGARSLGSTWISTFGPYASFNMAYCGKFFCATAPS